MATWFVYYLPDHVFVPWMTRKLNKRSTFSVTDGAFAEMTLGIKLRMA